jgi:L-alanine-DL-glutamate epimerase-like enolase superfamily enzyme
MVIGDREVIPVAIPMAGGGTYQAALFVIRSDGLVGLGEAPVVAGRGGSLESLVAELSAGAPGAPATRAAWESAHLDLDARRAGISVAALLGGAQRPGAHCTALVEEVRPDAVAAAVDRLSAAGFAGFKLKAANGGGQLDLERLGAARWAGGALARLRLDFNGGLSRSQAERALPSLGHLHLELVEQPLPAAAPAADWQALAAMTGVLLAADESLAEPILACSLAAQGTGLAIKLATVGGPRAALALAVAATGPFTLGSSYESAIGIAAALHVACALGREPLACGLATRRLLESDLATGLPEQPFLRLPDGPGLGVELDLEAVARYRLDR